MSRVPGIALLVLLASAFQANAGGVILYETGTPEVGLASAGWAARAEDASTVLTNPAGMSRLDGNDLMLGIQALYGDVGFTASSQTTSTGGNGGNPVGWFPGGGLYYVNATTDNVSLGVAVTGNVGLGLKYDDDWAGRYYIQSGTLLGMSVMPAIAWRIDEAASIGVALNAMYGILDTKVAVNNALPSYPDGQLKLDDTTWGIGANLGALLEPNEGTRLGMTYTLPVKLDFGATPEFSGLAPGVSAALQAAGVLDAPIDLSVTVPQTFMFSFDQRVNQKWSILGNVGWQDWSAFGKVDVQVNSANPKTLAVEMNFTDTWHAALGAQVKTASPWLITFGTAYDSSCVHDADRTPSLPVGATWRFGAGGRRPVSKKLELGIAYELAWGGNLPVDQQRGPLSGRLAGSYDSAAMHFLSMSLRWKL